ncbi:MAG: class I SAM-dependent methyltransferase [Armatimonadota bacterium]
MSDDYSSVTEVPGGSATKEQLRRLHNRYRVALEHSGGRRVLEVACGAGMGLGYLAKAADFVVGGDYTERLLYLAKEHYGDRMPLVRLDAQNLPFSDGAFDLVVIFEALYYLPDASRFVGEAYRVLSSGGTLIIGTVNKDAPGFVPSPFSTRYFSVPELCDLVVQKGFQQPRFFASFPIGKQGLKGLVLSALREAAVRLRLVPNTLEGRARLKRLFYGSLTKIPAEVGDDMVDEPASVEPIPGDVPDKDHQIVFCIASRDS